MGLFDKIFKGEGKGNREEDVKIPWHSLTSMEQLEEMKKESYQTKIAVFKHSTRCGISKMVLRKFENEFAPEMEGIVKLYFLDLLLHRDISNEIAQRFNVPHQSPQLIVLQDGKAIFNASHQAIEVEAINS